MLSGSRNTGSHRWVRFGALAVIGVGTGVFSSWYIYRQSWTWVTALLVGAFLIAAWLDMRRRVR